MEKALRTALLRLNENSELAASRFTPRQQKALRIFSEREEGVRYIRRGAGYVYQVVDRNLFNLHLENLAPDANASLPDSLPKRARNTSLHRDSKSGSHSHDCFYPLMKGVLGDLNWRETRKGVLLPLHTHTQTFGAVTLQLKVDDGWKSDAPLWLVENQEPFDYTEWFPKGEPSSLLYYAGNLSNLFIDWLAYQRRASRVILFPDYDGTGLSNYVRLREKLGEQCSFWLMPKWREKLVRYGCNELWQKNCSAFDRACEQLGDALKGELKELTTLMRENGLALEQEVVLR